MNDEQLDKILKKALTPQREIKEEEIVLKKRRKEEKMMRKKRMKMAGIAGTVAAALALACIVPQTSFAEQLKKMFQGYWGQRSELSDYVTRGVFSDQDEHMIFSVEEILSDEVVVSAVVRYEAKDETGEKWLATKGPAGSAMMRMEIFVRQDSCVLSRTCMKSILNLHLFFSEHKVIRMCSILKWTWIFDNGSHRQ